jgi:hypothetical protein
MRSHGWVALFASLFLAQAEAAAQDIVSAQSGVIHYSEGALSIDGTPFEHKAATFPLLKEGSTLQTARGRVELMLTPGVFLRLDENSSIKLISAALTATTVEFLHGSALLDALAAEGEIPVTLRYKDASVRFDQPGLFRIDSETGVLQAYSGEATVEQRSKKTSIGPSRLYFFELGTDTKKFSDGTDDEFFDWARNRNQVIAEENQQASAADDDADLGGALGNAPLFHYNPPMLPQLGTVYPSDGLFYSSYAASPFWTLPPLPTPLLVIGSRWAYRRPPVLSGTQHWPTTGTWATYHSPGVVNSWRATHPTATSHWPGTANWPTHHSPAGVNNNWLATHPTGLYPRPAGAYMRASTPLPRPTYMHPTITPHVSAPAAHVGRR